MKLLFLTIALALAFTGIQANAQSTQRFEHKLVFTLDYTYPGDTFVSPPNNNGFYNYERKKLTQKITNKVLLEALLTVESNAMGGTIQGWSISLFLDEGANERGVFLTKKGEDTIDVTEYINVMLYNSFQTARKGNSNAAGDSFKETGEWYGIGSLVLEIGTLSVSTVGASSVKYSYSTQTGISAVSNLDVSGLLGGASRDSTDGYIRGSIKGAKGTPIVGPIP